MIKRKLFKAYMKTAYNFAEMSYCERRKVGAIAVKDGRIIGEGYNGTPNGWENICEIDNKTLPHVLHAESNLISKIAKSNESSEGSVVFTTTEPCIECAKLMYQAGVKEVYYDDVYTDDSGVRKDAGVRFLEQCGVVCTQILERDEVE